jgi:hypothetical protein
VEGTTAPQIEEEMFGSSARQLMLEYGGIGTLCADGRKAANGVSEEVIAVMVPDPNRHQCRYLHLTHTSSGAEAKTAQWLAQHWMAEGKAALEALHPDSWRGVIAVVTDNASAPKLARRLVGDAPHHLISVSCTAHVFSRLGVRLTEDVPALKEVAAGALKVTDFFFRFTQSGFP